jgi:RNA polymerase sigma-70 factor (ECF subfamily)
MQVPRRRADAPRSDHHGGGQAGATLASSYVRTPRVRLEFGDGASRAGRGHIFGVPPAYMFDCTPMALNSDDISRLYHAHAAELLRFFARRTLQPEVAVDLVGETFAQAFADRAEFRGRSDREALAWIFGIARHELGDYFRRGVVERRALARLGVQPRPLTDTDYQRVEELASLGPLRAALAESLADLSRDQRQALQLRIVEERSYAELASRLGITEQTARARVSRALRALARAIEHLEEAPNHV